MIKIKCKNCSKEFMAYPSQRRRFCSISCSARIRKGILAPNWRGGQSKNRCLICKNYFLIPRGSKAKGWGKYCSNKCRGVAQTLFHSGKNSKVWKSGKRISKDGYVYVYAPNHPFRTANKCILEHRLVMEQHLKRFLYPQEIVHHINKKVNDNRIENLMLFPNNKAHLHYHKELRR